MTPDDAGEAMFYVLACIVSLVGSLIVWELIERVAALLRRLIK